MSMAQGSEPLTFIVKDERIWAVLGMYFNKEGGR